MLEKAETSFFVNGQLVEATPAQSEWTLVRFLRDVLRLTGTKQSCDNEGTCGTCTVIINGRAKRACIEKVSNQQGKQIETIESLALDGESPHPLLQTIVQDGIFQCGYCAPGALMEAKALLDRKPDPSEHEITSVLSSVICRCVGLNRMEESVQRAAAILRGDVASTWTSEDTANEYMMLDKLTGGLKYADDWQFADMLYASALRANMPHARVKKIDTSEAEAMPGIVQVLTSKDVPGKNIYGLIYEDQPIFCDAQNDVLYAGDALALVIGETPEEVESALDKIHVELEPLPVISTIDEALAPGAPVLHKRLQDKYPDMPNVLMHFHTGKGDIEAGFAEADFILEDDYEVPFVEHGYMEVETSIAVPENGGVVVHVGSQGPTDDRRQVAGALGFPEGKVRIAHTYMGGGFGGKEDVSTQIHAAMAATFTGRPVKVRWSRKESLLVSHKRHAARMHYKMGAKNDGRIVAADIKIFGDTGAYASSGEAVLFRMSAFACGPYDVPNVSVDAYAVHTNNPSCGAFRGYGSPQVAFAAEVHLQKIIDHLGLDPFEVRLKNGLDLGKSTITGDVITKEVGAGLVECLKAVQGKLSESPPPPLHPGERLGIGVAAAYKNVGLGSNIPDQSSARVSLEKEGTFLVRHGATDMGQGSNQMVAVIAARVLGVPLGAVRVHTGDTKYDPAGGMTTASRATFLSGNATLQAATGLKEMLWKAVSSEFGISESELELAGGMFLHKTTGQKFISLKDLASSSIPFSCESNYDAPTTQPKPAHSDAHPAIPRAPLHFAYDFGVQAAMVAVNEDTGAVRVLRLIAAHDVGTTLIRRNVIGQIEGAAVQGIGYALSEQFVVEKGFPKTLQFKDLKFLRLRDVPEIVPLVVENPHPKGPFGAKGMGELAISPTAPAIANAIHDAIGVWFNSLPIDKPKILTALETLREA
jgi:CO/xanthine dehydrogenase Mo-binding subunit/aerobic-type carbon monoxide dehydrogenase small subunit (CoxS/CutS family)